MILCDHAWQLTLRSFEMDFLTWSGIVLRAKSSYNNKVPVNPADLYKHVLPIAIFVVKELRTKLVVFAAALSH